MHSPSEMVAVSDLFHAAELLAAFVERLDEGFDFSRE
jgi:putative aminopeptidase FrvX